MRHAGIRLLAALVALTIQASAIPSADAATFLVGTGSGCTHGMIQPALDAAATTAGTNLVRITRSATWTGQALSIVADHNLTIEGGFADCTQPTSDGIRTTISGSGGAAASVLSITLPQTATTVTMRDLTIRDGDPAGSGQGGGIKFTGTGTLRLSRSTIQNNIAGHGGGIHAEGSPAAPARLVLDTDVLVLTNTARYDGGGIALDKAELTMNEAGSMVFGNVAEGLDNSGHGGGLLIRGTNTPAIARIGSGGANGLGAIRGNAARFGGGVAILGATSQSGPGGAELLLYTRTASTPGAISANVASVAGGGIYLRSLEGSAGNNNVIASARLWSAVLDANTAPDGAAVFLERHTRPQGVGVGARFELDVGTPPSPGTGCAGGSFCSRISGNLTQNTSGQPQWAATIWANMGVIQMGSPAPGSLTRGGALVEGNTAGRFVDGIDCDVILHNARITANTIGRQVVGGNCRSFELLDLTIAGNAITQSAVLELTGATVLRRSIVWQPGKTTLIGSGSRNVSDIVTSERASLDAVGGQFVEQADPRFVDPAHGDYSLRAASPALDHALAVPGDDRDAMGQPRDTDLPINTNTPRGPRDLGALERQSLLPFVLNADFDFSDLRLWTWFAGAWDGTQNISGGAGSGSWTFATSGQTASRFVIGQHCVHLPGPGRYRLNGRGKGGGNTLTSRDYAVLGWEFRRVGGEACTSGNADGFGEMTVGSGTSWGTAAQATLVEVAPATWTTSSSILIRLIAVDGGVSIGGSISAWFDGITLDIDGSETIFADGFDAR